jgi:beta-xylosidase
MKIKILAVVLTLSTLACGVFGGTGISTPESTPTEAETQPPASTSQPAPTRVTDPVAFRDDFEGSLRLGWQWIREDATNWSLTAAPGSLQISVGPGHVISADNSNLLLRNAPLQNFRIETKVNVQPVDNFQFAGLIIYESADNFIQAGRAFCDGNSSCVGDGFYMDYYEGGAFVAPNFASPFTEAVPVYLELTREGNSYTFQTSVDGISWELRGTIASEMKPFQIGLTTGQSTAGVIPAQIDYFVVEGVP